jgi:hypothetical protein
MESSDVNLEHANGAKFGYLRVRWEVAVRKADREFDRPGKRDASMAAIW